MLKKAQVIMLPTNNDGQGIYLSPITTINKIHYTTERILNSYIAQHLYIISDDEIKEGDKPCWCYNSIKNTWNKDIIYYQGAMPFYHFKGFKKIIATTDTSLRIYNPCIQCDGTGETTFSGTYTTQKKCDLCSQLKYPNTKSLPQPSQQFIEKYIEEYNRGNIIKDVLVEYEFQQLYKGKLNYQDMILNVECYNHDYNKLYKESNVGRFHKGKIISRETNCNGLFLTDKGEKQFCTLKELFFENLKINPKDNTITIKKLKDSWNREEHSLNLMNCVSELAAQFGHTPSASEMKKWNDATNDWIYENL